MVVRAPANPAGPVVVGVDGARNSAAPLGYSFEQAAWRGIGLTVVHADDAADPEERRLLDEAIAGWKEKYPDVPAEVRVVPGHPGTVLTTEARQACLLVVGSGHGEVIGLLLGSVSHHVLHRATCPVAVVRTR